MCMNKFLFCDFKCFISQIFLIILTTTKISQAQISDPIPEPIKKSELSVGLEEVVQIPNSGTDRKKAARLNLLTHAGDGSGRLFVNDMRGKLYVIVDGTATVYMDLKQLICADFTYESGQQGFAYFTFHPEFARNGIFYTVTSEVKDSGTPDFPVTKTILDSDKNITESTHHDVIREWKATDPSSNTFAGTSREILRIEEPYPDHNVGQLGFNPNAQPGDDDYGLLYIAVADGGSDGFPVSDTDPLDNGQDLETPLGKILRIDPLGNNSTNGQYGIPGDNPFVADNDPKTLDEIWAYGLRNPHRFSWDTNGEGKMLIADTGQAFIEEVNLGIKGANYGWGKREGTWVIDENNENVLYPLPNNDDSYGYTYPVAQYDHDIPPEIEGYYGIVITGGYVYRGKAIPELIGQYIFADFANDARFFHVPVDELVDGKQAKVKELRLFDGEREASFLEIIGKDRSDVRFGVDEEGEIYLTSKEDGKVRKLVPSPESSIPAKIIVTKTNYQGWQDSYILSNGQVEAVIVPKIGRVMQFRFKDGENTFWENDQISGQAPNPKSLEWDNFGGDKTWPAPQSEWEQITGRSWPPPATFDSITVTARVNRSEVTLISPIDPFYGIRIYRKITLEPHKPVMRITTTYEKVKGQPQNVSVWIVTQLRDPLAVYAALPQPSLFPEGYNKQSENLPANLKVDNGLLSLTRDRNQSHKIGSDGSTLLWMGEKVSVRIDSPRVLGLTYPDNNSSAEIYTNEDPKAYVELEFLSPLKTLKVGEKMDLTTTYTLIPRISENAEQEARKILGR